MLIKAFVAGVLATNSYVIVDESSRHAVIIDAPNDCIDEISAFVTRSGLVIDAIHLTHSHWDHTADAAALKTMYSVPVSVHQLDEYRMLRPGQEMIRPPFPLEPLSADSYLEHNQCIALGDIEFRVIHTPGHTEGSVCFYAEREEVLISGDTLFAGSVGRTDLPGGDWQTFILSLRTELMVLPEAVRVYPGHGPATTIGNELQFNPFLNGQIAG